MRAALHLVQDTRMLLQTFCQIVSEFTRGLRLEDTYAARHMKIRPILHVSLKNSVARPSFKILSGVFFLPSGLVTELLRETCKGGQFSCVLAA